MSDRAGPQSQRLIHLKSFSARWVYPSLNPHTRSGIGLIGGPFTRHLPVRPRFPARFLGELMGEKWICLVQDSIRVWTYFSWD